MAEKVRRAEFAEEIDLIVPIRLHEKRRRERGFDQAALLAETVADVLGIEYAFGAVGRVKVTQPQASLRKAERLVNMHGVFEAAADVAGKTVLLIDDVFTTGATMRACADACREKGAKNVFGAAFAR